MNSSNCKRVAFEIRFQTHRDFGILIIKIMNKFLKSIISLGKGFCEGFMLLVDFLIFLEFSDVGESL